MKNYYTIDEITELVYGEQEEAKYSVKYRELREKFADMPQEQFDDYYRAFVGTSGVIGGNQDNHVDDDIVAMINAVAKWFYNYGINDALSISDIMVESYKNLPKGEDKKMLKKYFYNNQRHSSNPGIYLHTTSSGEWLRSYVKRFLISLAEQREIGHVKIKTCGRVCLHMFYNE